MCTAVSFGEKYRYFGRNLDLEYHYNEEVVCVPRNFNLVFKRMPALTRHNAIIGMATVCHGYPLFYDAANEYGLACAALNFVGNAHYREPRKDALNLAPYEVIPYILARCKTVTEALGYIKKLNIVNIPFDSKLSLSELHFMLADKDRCIVIESTREGIFAYDDPFRVLTNNPPFPYHKKNMANYLNLTAMEPQNRFSDKLTLEAYSRGMGAIGLPGDFSSASRFVRAAFVAANAVYKENDSENVAQFFHILAASEVVEGCVRLDGGNVKTVYSSCIDTERGIYYFRTYESLLTRSVSMNDSDIDGKELRREKMFLSV